MLLAARSLLLAVPLAALPAAAHAQDLRLWQSVHEGMLKEASEGDLQSAISWYEGLAESVDPDEPSAGELYYWLGRARYIQGESEGARRALRQAAEAPETTDRARALLGQIDALDLQVRKLPVSHTFDTGTSHWLHAWERQGRGAIDIGTPEPGDDPAMAWATAVADRQDDKIQMGFSPQVTPASFELSFRSRVFPAYVLVAVEDDRGAYYSLPDPVEIPTDGWVTVEAKPEDFRPIESGASAGAGNAWPRTIRNLILADITAFASSDRGPNTIYVDDVYIR
jgi:tetratricopeptide (TPR) repeat protein